MNKRLVLCAFTLFFAYATSSRNPNYWIQQIEPISRPCEDNNSFRDEIGSGCTAWREYNCSTIGGIVSDWGYSSVDMLAPIRENCPVACSLCISPAREEFRAQIEEQMLEWTWCSDNPYFLDIKGFSCSDWEGSSHEDIGDDYDQQARFLLTGNCGVALGLKNCSICIDNPMWKGECDRHLGYQCINDIEFFRGDSHLVSMIADAGNCPLSCGLCEQKNRLPHDELMLSCQDDPILSSNVWVSALSAACSSATTSLVCQGWLACDLTFLTGYVQNRMPKMCGRCLPPQERLSCKPGSYRELSNLRNISCSPCPQGMYSPVPNASMCLLAPVGHYVQRSNEIKSIPCEAGSYSAALGSVGCSLCDAGNYSAKSGASRCSLCSRGHFSTQGSAACESCVPGSYQADEGKSACISCGFLRRAADDDSGCVLVPGLLAIGIASVIVIALMVLFASWQYRKVRRLQAESRYEHLKTCICQANELLFPMYVISAEDMLALPCMTAFEELHRRMYLTSYISTQEIQDEMINSGLKLVFVSHQWLSFNHPDPKNVQFLTLKAAMNTVAAYFGWKPSEIMIWLDFQSIPQTVCGMQLQAIASLPVYASMCSAFIVLAPETQHQDTDLICNADTYRQRLWCRVELFSHYMRRGREEMYILRPSSNGHELASLDQSWLTEALFVFEGDCTCCFRKHDGVMCDKPFVRDLMLGLYAQVLWNKDRGSRVQRRRAREIYDLISSNKARTFPGFFVAEFANNRNCTHRTYSLRPTSSSSEIRPAQLFTSSVNMFSATKRSVPLFGELLTDLETRLRNPDKELQRWFRERLQCEDFQESLSLRSSGPPSPKKTEDIKIELLQDPEEDPNVTVIGVESPLAVASQSSRIGCFVDL